MERSQSFKVKARCFAYYKLPGGDDFTVISQDSDPVIFNQLADLSNDHQGFLIAPFDATQGPLVLIRPEFSESYKISDYPDSRALGACDEFGFDEVDFKAYAATFESCIRQLQADELKKIVLSFSFNVSTHHQSLALENIFLRACHAFPKSYVALWSTPDTGTWLTITPEVILESTALSQFHTVALAGTMRREQASQPPVWSAKNTEEQKYVADYILSQLEALNIKAQVMPTRTVEAANLLHLCTDFYFTSDLNIGALLAALHPTPAVCGMPQMAALDQILKIEQHQRGYYAGFSGPLNLNHQTHLYVTLRCANCINVNQWRLYAGGGLLKESVLQDEWHEIIAKVQTAYKIIQ